MFTDKSLRALQPRKTTYRVFEKSVDKGFCVQLTPAGGIYFYMQYQSPVTNRRRFLPLGRYPTVSLAEAREKLRVARKTLSAGKDPRFTENSRHRYQVHSVMAFASHRIRKHAIASVDLPEMRQKHFHPMYLHCQIQGRTETGQFAPSLTYYR